MSGGDDVTVVWVAPPASDPRNASVGAQAGPGDDRDDAARALVEWGRARGLRIVSPKGNDGTALGVDLTVADRVEEELVRARDGVAALDADVAERALARAETLLRDHPELPQAAWLRAEVDRGWVARWNRIEPRDEARAQAAWQDAEALDGGRVPGIGEITFAPRASTAATLAVRGASRTTVARLDGRELAATSAAEGVTSYAIDVPAAEHQIVVTLDGVEVFASWVAIPRGRAAGSPPFRIPIHLGDGGSCSAGSLEGVTRDAAGVHAGGVRCDRWVVATPAPRRGAVLVARCAGSACGPFLEWRSGGGLDATGSPPPALVPHGGGWPAWATWAVIGAGVVAATTVTLVATGVFESRPTEQRFVAGGVKIE